MPWSIDEGMRATPAPSLPASREARRACGRGAAAVNAAGIAGEPVIPDVR